MKTQSRIWSVLILLSAITLPLSATAEQSQKRYDLTGKVRSVAPLSIKIGSTDYKLSPVVKVFSDNGKTVLVSELTGKSVGAKFERIGNTNKQIKQIWIIPENEVRITEF